MDLWPAIDIRQGRCVRLRRGDFSEETTYGDPVEVATQFLEAGAERLHVVDLDAAVTGHAVNRDLILSIARRTGILVQAGGGVRSVDDAAALLDGGAARVVVGTAALRDDRSVLEAIVERFPRRVAVGLDYRAERGEDGEKHRMLSANGWTERTSISLERALVWLTTMDLASVIVTDINRDGTGAGPDLTEYQELLDLTSLPIVASGGVASPSDIARLARIESGGQRLAGVVVGKALLSGAMTLSDARHAALGLTR